MKALRMLAPTMNNPNVYPVPADPDDSPREVMRLGLESIKVELILAVVVPVLSFALLAFLSLALSTVDIVIPALFVPLVPVALGLFLLLAAVISIMVYAWRSSVLESTRMESQQRVKELEAQAKLTEAEAKLAAARPAVIAEVIRPVPVANPQAKTMTDAPEQAQAIPAKPRFLNDTDMPIEDVRWFVSECLKMGRHSRGAWFSKPLSERTAPSGKPINDIPDYDRYIDLLVKYKIIINREAGKTGDWLIKDEAEVFQLLGI